MSRRIVSPLKVLLFVLLSFITSSIWADQLTMISQPGDYIGQGLITDLDSTSHNLTPSVNFDNGISVNVIGINGVTSDVYWYLDFTAPGEVQLTPGVYENALRFPFQGSANPGLSVSGNGRGCNTLTGRFTVIEVIYNPDNTVGQFAADFEQHCEGAEPGLYGAIRINSQVPINIVIPELIADAGTDQTTLEDQQIVLDGSSSYSNDGSAIVSYSWSQVSGIAVPITNAATATASIVTPTVPLGGDTLVFRLEVMNSNGQTAVDEMNISVLSKSDPQSYIAMQSDSGDHIGQGQAYFFSSSSGNLTVNSNDPDVVNIDFQDSNFWNFDFAAPDATGLTQGLYLNATRYPFNPATEPGMSVYGAGRGCNTLSGQFNVLQMQNDAAGIQSLAIDFEQHCESQTPALYGQIRYNYVDPSVPSANAGADQNVLSGDTVFMDGSASSDNDGNIVAYWWEQVSGTPVNLQVPDSAVGVFVAPSLPENVSETVTFRLTVTDDLGFMAADTVTVTITGIAQPISYCDASGINTRYEWIETVDIGNVSNTSGDNAGYGDYTATPLFVLDKSVANTITLTPGFRYGAYTEYWKVWLDSNQDGTFQANEELLSGSNRSSINSNITLPAETLTGETRLRIAMRYGGAPSSCGNFYWGEVEDYTVIVQ